MQLAKALQAVCVLGVLASPARAQAPAPQFLPIALDLAHANELIDEVSMPRQTREAIIALINRWERETAAAHVAAAAAPPPPPAAAPTATPVPPAVVK